MGGGSWCYDVSRRRTVDFICPLQDLASSICLLLMIFRWLEYISKMRTKILCIFELFADSVDLFEDFVGSFCVFF